MIIHSKGILNNRVAAVILLRQDGAALMQLRDEKRGLRNAGMWVPPGGHAEPNEDIKICARREFLEETDYDCPNLKYLTEFVDHVEGWPAYVLTFFWAYYDGIQQLKCLEGQDLKFINYYNAGSYNIPEYLLEVWEMALKLSKEEGVKE